MKKLKFVFIITILVLVISANLSILVNERKVYASEVYTSEDQNAFLDDDASKESLGEIIEKLLGGLNISQLQKMFDELSNVFLSGRTLNDILEASLSGSQMFELSSIFKAIFEVFMNNIKGCVTFFITVITIAFLGGLAQSFEHQNNRLSDLIFLVTYGAICIILFNECAGCLKSTKAVLTNVCKQSEGVFPLLLTLVLICGGKSSSAVFKPVCVFLNNGVLQIILKILFPILSFACVIAVIASLNEKFGLKNLFNFLLDIFKWIIGITIVVFTFFVTINGFGASIYDGVSLRALKYAIGNSVPILGSFAKDGIDLIIASGILIKNSIGGISIFLIFSALLSPFLMILSLSLTLKLLNAVIQPFADVRICSLINSLSKVISYVCVLLLTVFIVYFVTLFLIISAQNQIMVA